MSRWTTSNTPVAWSISPAITSTFSSLAFLMFFSASAANSGRTSQVFTRWAIFPK
jgi:hypothetical protein